MTWPWLRAPRAPASNSKVVSLSISSVKTFLAAVVVVLLLPLALTKEASAESFHFLAGASAARDGTARAQSRSARDRAVYIVIPLRRPRERRERPGAAEGPASPP